MSLTITGADPTDRGPAGCLARFMIASAAADAEAAAAELHPDSRALVTGAPSAPPGVEAVEILATEPGDERVLIPTRMTGSDGSEQRFTFVVRPHADGFGVDLEASMQATFGGDPLQMMEDAMRTAVAPLADALDQIGSAFAGGSEGSAATARRIAADADMPESAAILPERLDAEVLELDLHHRRKRADADSDWTSSGELTVRCVFALDPAWIALSAKGVALEVARSCEGEDLRPTDAGEDLGAENYSSWEREGREVYVRLPLTAPAAGFTGLAELSGSVRLDLVGGELLEIALGPVGELLDHRVDLPALGLTMELSRDGDGQLCLRLPAGGFDRLEEITPVDAAGEAINRSWNGYGDGETDTRSYSGDIGDDASLVLRFWSRREIASIPFHAAGLPAFMV